MKTKENLDPRFYKWIKLSHQISFGEPFLVPFIQNLGSMEMDLDSRERLLLAEMREKNELPIESLVLLNRVMSDSQLWVLGAYEAIRTVSQRADIEAQAGSFQKAEAEKIRTVKHYFERVRVPLAKMEPSKRHKDTDSKIAYPTLLKEHGVAWMLNEEFIVSRLELSNAFLSLLKE